MGKSHPLLPGLPAVYLPILVTAVGDVHAPTALALPPITVVVVPAPHASRHVRAGQAAPLRPEFAGRQGPRRGCGVLRAVVRAAGSAPAQRRCGCPWPHSGPQHPRTCAQIEYWSRRAAMLLLLSPVCSLAPPPPRPCAPSPALPLAAAAAEARVKGKSEVRWGTLGRGSAGEGARKQQRLVSGAAVPRAVRCATGGGRRPHITRTRGGCVRAACFTASKCPQSTHRQLLSGTRGRTPPRGSLVLTCGKTPHKPEIPWSYDSCTHRKVLLSWLRTLPAPHAPSTHPPTHPPPRRCAAASAPAGAARAGSRRRARRRGGSGGSGACRWRAGAAGWVRGSRGPSAERGCLEPGGWCGMGLLGFLPYWRTGLRSGACTQRVYWVHVQMRATAPEPRLPPRPRPPAALMLLLRTHACGAPCRYPAGASSSSPRPRPSSSSRQASSTPRVREEAAEAEAAGVRRAEGGGRPGTGRRAYMV